MVDLSKLTARAHANPRAARETMEERNRQLRLAASNGVFVLEQCGITPVHVHNNVAPEWGKFKVKLQRLAHNLNFIIVCEICHGPHAIDELVAPER